MSETLYKDINYLKKVLKDLKNDNINKRFIESKLKISNKIYKEISREEVNEISIMDKIKDIKGIKKRKLEVITEIEGLTIEDIDIILWYLNNKEVLKEKADKYHSEFEGMEDRGCKELEDTELDEYEALEQEDEKLKEVSNREEFDEHEVFEKEDYQEDDFEQILRGGIKSLKLKEFNEKQKKNKDSNNIVQLSDKREQRNIEGKVNYNEFNITKLFDVVSNFMINLGVRKVPINKDKLDEEFGKHNIGKLIRKGYIIYTQKGITLGKKVLDDI